MKPGGKVEKEGKTLAACLGGRKKEEIVRERRCPQENRPVELDKTGGVGWKRKRGGEI